jgi:hypothetical protein
MMLNNIHTLRWTNAAHSAIELLGTHAVYGEIPFTASPNDTEAHGRDIFARCIAGEFGPIAEYAAPPYIIPPVPSSVSRFQARAALHLAGYLAAVDAAMQAPETDFLAKLAWQDAQEFYRSSPLVIAMGASLGLSSEQLDDLFRFASTIKA